MPTSSRKGKRPDHAEVRLDMVTNTVLRTLESVAKASPVPGLSEAAGMALQISETVQVCLLRRSPALTICRTEQRVAEDNWQ